MFILFFHVIVFFFFNSISTIILLWSCHLVAIRNTILESKVCNPYTTLSIRKRKLLFEKLSMNYSIELSFMKFAKETIRCNENNNKTKRLKMLHLKINNNKMVWFDFFV